MKTRTDEMEHVQRKTRAARPIIGGFLVGSAIGVATALLFAPRSGQETRAEIRGKAIELRDRTGETVRGTVEQARERAHELKDTVREKAEGLKQRGRYTVTRQLDNASRTMEAGGPLVQES